MSIKIKKNEINNINQLEIYLEISKNEKISLLTLVYLKFLNVNFYNRTF